ncbi:MULTISPECIES: ABC transporter substrate-binding protein [Glycomyces]|uniref:Multiple sugar transport system substrate-binding protein n=2 Tax=Glycomyces TaxID=58113 RepID=A0A9X3PI94_9ACTN|nr:sugar ABC transporter substrate-binding protein [Glycomyces lechevalierae]MDA1385986.1 sugar ABC transporter substrate-binding protein [Glycomyces lechevalierae]MDR7340857.1 multiple sugar transport system substrate-binding protein [Glycomyces lechevalierae]
MPTTAKKLVSALALGTLAAAAGCAGTTASDENVALRMTVWTSNEDHLALFDSIADAYIADHPEIESITFESLPFEEYNTTLTTQIAGGNAPDLAWMGDLSADLIDSGALVPLTETLEGAEGWDYGDLVPSVTGEFSRDGELYAYPFSNSPFALYVNTDLLAEAGQTLDPAALTWDQVSALGSAVHAATGKGGFVVNDFNYSSWNTLATVWTAFGASAWNEDGTECGFASPEMTDAFTFLHNAVYTDESMPGPGVTADFFAGDAAFAVAQVSRAGNLDGSFAYDIQPLPQGPAGDYSVIGQAGMGVLQSSAHVEAATGFLAYLTDPENAAKLAQYFPPPRQSLLTGEGLAANNTKFTAEQLQTVVVDQVPGAVTLPNHTNPAEVAQKAKTALDAMWTPDADVPAVLASVCDAIDPLLAA